MHGAGCQCLSIKARRWSAACVDHRAAGRRRAPRLLIKCRRITSRKRRTLVQLSRATAIGLVLEPKTRRYPMMREQSSQSAQVHDGEFLATFQEFPPSQKVGSFSA